MKNYFKSLLKYKKEIFQIGIFVLSIVIFSVIIYSLDNYIQRIQCCTHMDEFYNKELLIVFFCVLIPYVAFRIAKKAEWVSIITKVFMSLVGTALYLPVIFLFTLFIMFSWWEYAENVDVGIFNENVVSGFFAVLGVLILTYLHYKYILFKKYTFVIWIIASFSYLGLLFFAVFDDKYIFLGNKIILLLAGLIFLVIIVVDKYIRKFSTLAYLVIMEIVMFLVLVINFTTGLYLHYDYNKTSWLDFRKCESSMKKSFEGRDMLLVDDGVCLNRRMVCRIVDGHTEKQCIELNHLGYLQFFPAQYKLNQNKERFWDLELPSSRRVIIWRYHSLIRVTPVSLNSENVHFFVTGHNRGQYLTDGEYIYYGNRRAQANIDMDTFKYLGWRCAEDKNIFIYQGRVATEQERLLCARHEDK